MPRLPPGHLTVFLGLSKALMADMPITNERQGQLQKHLIESRPAPYKIPPMGRRCGEREGAERRDADALAARAASGKEAVEKARKASPVWELRCGLKRMRFG